MPLFDPNLRGRYIKLGAGAPGQPSGFVKIGNIARAVRGNDAQGPHLVVHLRGGGVIRYRGNRQNQVKSQLEREGVGEV